MTADRLQLGGAIAAAYRTLIERGLVHGSAGNISVRYGASCLITPTGSRGGVLAAEGMVAIDADGTPLPGEAGVPSSEWAMHTALYQAFPGAGAVVHTHSDACVALSCLREPLPSFHYMVAGFGGDEVRCADYAPFGSRALSDAMLAAMEGRTACLLANHGMICHGRTLAEAMDRAEKLEVLCRQYALARQLGRPVILTREDMDEVRARYRDYGKKRLSP